MIKPSERIREILSNLFPQEKNFEDSVFPINTDYSLPFYEIDKKRIIIYQTDGRVPQEFLGNNELLRNFTFDVIVAAKDDKQAFAVSNMIFNYLRKYKDDEYVRIMPLNDITPMGINSKKHWLYVCSYGIIKDN